MSQQYLFATNTLILGLVGCFLLYKNIVLPAVVCFIAAISYAYMLASTYIAFTQRDVNRARYIDWAITTPILLYIILSQTELDHRIIYALMVSDFIMILLGYFATKSRKYALVFFWLSCLFFVPIFYFLSRNLSNPLAVLTLIVWSLYPIIWWQTHNYTISTETSNLMIGILDLIAKAGFSLIYLWGAT